MIMHSWRINISASALTSSNMLLFIAFMNLEPNGVDTLQESICFLMALQWRHNERDGVSNHRRLNYFLNRLFRRRLKETSKLRVTGLCEGNSPVTGEFPTQSSINAENFSIWWRHCGKCWNYLFVILKGHGMFTTSSICDLAQLVIPNCILTKVSSTETCGI